MPVISLKNITKNYPFGKGQVEALRDISLEIEAGEFVAIIGNSGSGKTTLMNILGCLDISDGGEYQLKNQNVAMLNPDELSTLRNQTIGFVFQSFHLIPTLTALENVELPLTYRGIKKSKRISIAKEALIQVGLEQRMRHFPSQLSGGQQQRTAIARAMVTDPTVLLADEPTGNLDSSSGNQIIKMLRALNRQGKTVILITHDQNVAAQTHRMIEMKDGRLCRDSKINS